MFSKIISFLMISVMAFAVGCGKKDDDKGDKKKDSEELVDTTNYTSCGGPGFPGASIFNNGWKRTARRADGQIIQQVFQVQANQVTVIQSCTSQGITGIFELRLPAFVQGNRITMQAAEVAGNMEVNGKPVSCNVAVGGLDNAEFNFTGACLQIINSDGKIYRFIPEI